MWQVLIKMALPAIIRALEGRIGGEAMEVMQTAIMAVAIAGLSGDEKRAVAWSMVLKEWAELKLAIAEEVAAGVPWFVNLAFEALVARSQLAKAAQASGQKAS